MKEAQSHSVPGLHEAAAKGFQLGTDAYDRGRPGYPEEAIDYLCQELHLGPEKRCVDLAAGTGKLARHLVRSGVELVAVEPVSAMRQKFSALLPEIPVVDGRAESIPVSSGSADAVVIGQAFHWFANEPALREIHRTLKPGGQLALIWNVRDEANDWMFQLTKMLNPYEKGTPQYRTSRWKEVFNHTLLFSPLRAAHFVNIQRGSLATVLDRVASISYIAVLDEEERQSLLGDVRNLLENHPMTAGRAEFEIPYRTDVFLCSKIA